MSWSLRRYEVNTLCECVAIHVFCTTHKPESTTKNIRNQFNEKVTNGGSGRTKTEKKIKSEHNAWVRSARALALARDRTFGLNDFFFLDDFSYLIPIYIYKYIWSLCVFHSFDFV